MAGGACKALGVSPENAKLIAHDISVAAASCVGTATAIVTFDPIGGALSASLLGFEINEHRPFKKGHA
jgi:ABC-type branched-subunit amino acid transport system permease subunit